MKSRRIRELLSRGETNEAEGLLGRPYTVIAPVSRGRGHGRKLGFRTLNLRTPAPKLLPAPGSYAARIRLAGASWDGVAFVPRGVRRLLEVHLPGFGGVPYGTAVQAELGRYIAAPRDGLGEEELKAKIEQEVEKAMEVCRTWR